MSYKRILVLIIVIFFILSLGYVLNRKNENPKTKTEIKQNSPSKNIPIPTFTLDTNKTKGWHTYKNSKYAFEIRYPDGWKFLGVSDEMNMLYFGDKDNFEIEGYDGDFFVRIYDGHEITVEQLISEIGMQFEVNRNEKREKMIINGLPATKAIVTTNQAKDWQSEQIIIQNEGKIYVISNGAVKNKLFDEFYKSFRVVN